MTSAIGRLALLGLVWLSAAVVGISSPRLRKCCPAGEIFSGQSKVNCVPTPPRAIELHSFHYDGELVHENGFPVCELVDDVTTTPLFQIASTDLLQLPLCLEILHVQGNESVPIVAHCRSNKDREEAEETQSVSLPRLFDVRRCCPKNNLFDVRSKSCVSALDIDTYVNPIGNYSDTDELLPFLAGKFAEVDFLKVSTGMPNCTEAMFTYAISEGDITFENGALQAMLPSSSTGEARERFAMTVGNTCLGLTTDFPENRQLVARVCRSSDTCQHNRCLRKCCPENQSYVAGSRCTTTDAGDASMVFYEKISAITNGTWEDTGFGLMVKLECKNDMYALNSLEFKGLTAEGFVKDVAINKPVPHDQYCLDVFYNTSSWNETLIPLLCFPTTPLEQEYSTIRFTVNSILQSVSCVFLLLTLLVYICLPALQNLHGKTLMCHSASLLLAYTCLAIVPWVTPKRGTDDNYATNLCATLAYMMYFAFLSAFSWLNVMCFDIWRTFGSLRGNVGRGRSHGKRFLLYSLYAWGFAMLATVFAILSDTVPLLSENFRPNFGLLRCWFNSKRSMYGELIFFRVPISIQLIANVVFFIITSEHCSKVKAEIRRVADPSDPRSKRFHADKTKLVMNVKLFVVMGITWIAEIVSSFMNEYTDVAWKDVVFYGSDVINCLQGLLIFILFALKPRVYQALRKRLGFDEKKKCSSQGNSTLQDPFKVKKSGSNSTLTSSFAISATP
ncbi:G-protein coupled receptor Mth2 isoform X2 [Andrena cerasifolii]|uniref:G-protein coupled receptor Mth2 isoform X2 n=1 Tax=Andrena cerasifolii TaxID=2819439 RepID=UPI004037FED2